MENLYGFPANQTLLFVNSMVANLPLFISLGLAAVVGIRSLRKKVNEDVDSLDKSKDLVKAA